MKKASVFNKVLSVLLVISLVMALAVPGLAAQTGVSFKKVSNNSVSAKFPGRDAADLTENEDAYADTDVVRVSIVLDKAGTLEAGYKASAVSSSFLAKLYRNGLKRDQANVTSKIEKATKQELDVVWNLTLAANIISANVAYGQIETIEAVNGVAEVLIETQYAPDVVSTGAADPNMATSGKQIGSAPAWAAGYTGAGSRIAIIDTGVDIDHQSFSAAAFEASLMYNAGKAGMSLAEYKETLGLLTAAEIDKVAAELNVPVTGAEAYINSKIPFGYNYVDGDYDVTHDNDGQGSHGSHVSGIAAANAYIPSGDGFVAALESAMVQGVAPDAQLITMKVFGKTGGAYDSDYMAAIEDAVLLGADSVNLSLGSGNPGRSRNSNAEYQAILDSLADSGVVVAMSAGNSGYWAEASYPVYLYADDVSMHTGGSPGSFTNSLGVASVDNDGKTGLYFTVGGSMVVYNETEYSNEPFSTLAGEQEYVIIDGIGSAEEWAAVGEALVGKIAICSRGEISFYEKAVYAVEAGAIGTFIYNNDAGIINMDLSDYPYTQPCASLTQADGLAIMAASTPVADEAGNVLYYTGTMTISETMGAGQFNSPYYTMSSFSSWGVPQSLLLKPEITAPGGSIYSVNGVDKSGTAYEVMSGTSMASPQVAGMAAVLAQYIKEAGLEAATGLTARQLAQSLLMSTAVPMLDATYSYYPVIQQGAGLGNVGAAVLADTYILMNADATESYADGKVKAELGDDPDKTGKYEFSFTINNLEDVEKLYNLSADFFIQAPVSDGVDMYMYTSTALIGALTTFTVDGEEVGAIWDMDGADYNGDGAVNVLDGQALLDYATGVRTELTNEDKADLDADGDIDSYDAYLFLAKAESLTTVPAGGSVEVTVNVTIPDDWKSTIDYYYPNGTYIQGYVYADGVSSEEGVMGTSHSIPVLGFYGNWSDASMYDKGSALEYAHGEETRAPYLGNTDANAFTVVYGNEPGTQYLFGGNPLVPDATYMPERNAISAANGDKIGKVSFTAIRNAAASLYYVEDLTNGALLKYAMPGAVDSAYYYVNGGVWRNTGYGLNIGFSPAGLEEGTQLELGLTLAPEYYVDAEGNVAWDALGEGATFSIPMVVDNTAPTLEDVSLSLTGKTLTVTAYDNQYIAAVALYNKRGTQVMAYTGAKQDIAPEESAAYVLDLSEVKGSKFLLQVMDYAMNTTTYEINLGGEDEPVVLPDRIAFDLDDNFWTSFDKTYTYQDIVEYAPSDYTYFAGTIVDEYAFAATDEGVLHVMPLEDLTDVTVVADLGTLVLDMAYNKADGKVYGVNEYGYLITIDKLNGQIAIVGEVGVLTNTLACDANGTFYCNEYGTGNVYSFTLDTVAEPTLLTTVVEVESQYVQAMEIDPNTGLLCWNSYYMFSFMGYTFGFSYYYEIDTATGEYTEYEDLWDELSALMIPDKSSGGNWSDPTDKVTGIQINPPAASLLRGETLALTASVQPWTATDRTVTWTSDNEAVATVDEDGVVTAVGAGTATITATSNLDPSFSATCAVTVSILDITIQGTLQDEEGNSMFYDWNLAEDETWTGGAAIDTSMTSATVDTLNNKAYIMDAVSNVWNMHIVDPETGAIEMTGANGAAVPLWDMEYSTVFSTAEAPKINSIYYYYFLPAKDPMALDTSAFGLSSYLSQYSGASWLVAIASAGYEVVEDLETGEPIETEHVMMLDNAGYIWDFWIYPTDSGFSAQLNFAPTNLADLGVEFPGDAEGENMYTSMVVGEDGNLYLSAFTGETNELYRLIYDAATESYAAQFIGDVGEGVWPATITSVTVNAAAASDSAAAPKATMKMNSVTVSAEEMAAAKVDTTIAKSADSNKAAKVEMLKAEASEKAETEAVKSPVALQPMMGSAVVDEKEDYVTVTITAGAPELEAAALSDELYTNGVTTVTWDVESLTLVDIAMNADYTSINEGEGTVTLGYVQLDGYNADDVVATLYFEVKNTDAETVTVVYNEVNNEHPGVEEEVAINYPHANTEIRDAKEATCTEDGYTGDTYCTDCGKLVAKGEVIPAKGHGETEIKDAKEATCTEDGYTGDTYCTVCGEKIADGEVIPAKGHGETEIKDAKDATCTEDGYTGDTYCTVCGEKIADGEVIPAKGHGETEIKDAKDATCTEDGYTGDTYCTVCGEKIADGETVAAKGHNYESVVTKPTVDAEGYTTHTCTDCGHSYVDSYTDKVDPENPKTVETFRNILAASLLVMSVAAVAGLYMISRKKEF